MPTKEKPAGLILVYDGDCPFCSRYIQLLKLRKSVGTVELINARSQNSLAAGLHAAGFDLNEGMVAKYGDRIYHGADCIQLLALLSTNSGAFNRLNGVIFRSTILARILYPILRFGRNATLRLLGRAKIEEKNSI